jgi:hypothetical protein
LQDIDDPDQCVPSAAALKASFASDRVPNRKP